MVFNVCLLMAQFILYTGWSSYYHLKMGEFQGKDSREEPPGPVLHINHPQANSNSLGGKVDMHNSNCNISWNWNWDG